MLRNSILCIAIFSLSACSYSTNRGSYYSYTPRRDALRGSSLRAAQSSGRLLAPSSRAYQGRRGGLAYWIISPIYLDAIDALARQIVP